MYSLLTNDAEKYVFFTLVLQEYRIETFYAARKKLKPQFGKSIIDLSKYEQNNRRYTDTLITDRLDTLSEPLLLPSDVNAGVNVCTPYSCSEMYEFVDPQLNELVKTGDTALNSEQLSNLIALMVYT